MQCPACNHIPLAGSTADPNRCPKCGINYADVIRAKAAKAANPQPSAADEMRREALKVKSVRSAEVNKMMQGYDGASPVVIVDINMSFNSMVWFMVKWAIAAIPALIILFFIALAVMVMFGVSLR